MHAIRHLLIVDDDTRIRGLLEAFLKEKGFFVSVAKDVAAARDMLALYKYDLCIVDIMMPGETGLEFMEKLRETSDVPVIMLTAMGNVEDRIIGFEKGADDYLPKPFEPAELLVRIRSILGRARRHSALPHILHFGILQFDLESKSLSRHGVPVPLTSKEVELLTILAGYTKKVISREKLAELCDKVNERTIDVQVTRLRNKIEEDPKRPLYLKTVRGEGYVLYYD